MADSTQGIEALLADEGDAEGRLTQLLSWQSQLFYRCEEIAQTLEMLDGVIAGHRPAPVIQLLVRDRDGEPRHVDLDLQAILPTRVSEERRQAALAEHLRPYRHYFAREALQQQYQLARASATLYEHMHQMAQSATPPSPTQSTAARPAAAPPPPE